MIVITQPNATEEQIERIVARVREFGLDAQISRGASRVIIGVIGAEDRIREKPLAAMPGVEAIIPVEKPYRLASYESRGAASPRRSSPRSRTSIPARPRRRIGGSPIRHAVRSRPG
jgi:3-deoxy-7-phosphoheptulonate synthase